MPDSIAHFQIAAYIAAALVCVYFSAVFSGTETGLYCLNRVRLRLAAHRNEKSALRLQRLIADQSSLLFTTLLGTNAANYLAPIFLTLALLLIHRDQPQSLRENLAEITTTLILTPVIFIFGEIVPKVLFQRNADLFMARFSALLAATHAFTRRTGIIAFQKALVRLAQRRLGRRRSAQVVFHPRIEVYQMIREGAAAGALSRTQASMLDRVRALEDIRLSQVMIPAASAIMLEENADRRQIERVARQARVWRIPVYRAKRRHVIGIVHLLDLLTHPAPLPALTALARPATNLPHDMHVIDAIAAMRRARQRLAVVTDSYGRCMGIITLRDLVGEIIGELTAP